MKIRKVVAVLLSAVIVLGSGVLLEKTTLLADSDGDQKVVSDETSDDEIDVDIPIDSDNFPDPYFREFVKQYDLNGDGKLSLDERDPVQGINFYREEDSDMPIITTLKGVEYFTELMYLNFHGHAVTSIDISQNTKLTSIQCGENQITELDLSHNPLLDTVEVDGNPISSLDVTMLPNLMNLMLCRTSVSSLDLSNNPDLYYLDFAATGITSIDLSHNRKLRTVVCYYSNIPELDLSDREELTMVWCDGSLISSLNVSNCPNLKELSCGSCKLKTLDLTTAPSLQQLYCGDNELTTLDLSKNTDLQSLDCILNNLTELDVSANTKLYFLQCSYNPLKSLNLGNNDNLYRLACLFTGLDEINIYGCPLLIDLYLNVKPEIYEDGVGRKYYVYERLRKGGEEEVCDLLAYEIGMTINTTVPQPKADFTDFIERMYVVALNRPSEPEGKAFWMEKITKDGFTGGRVAIGFLIEAPEFLNRQLTDEQFVDVLYKTFFDREADASGKAFWIGHLTTDMTREQVVRGFIDSIEWCNLCASYGVKSGAPNAKAEKPSQNATKFAKRLYTQCLGREADEGGLQFWALRLTNLESSGAEAAFGFFNSTEFKNLNLSDYDFVFRLYRTFMGREPDDSGLEFWNGQLATGNMTRNEVIKGFAESQEFTNICLEYGIDRGSL